MKVFNGPEFLKANACTLKLSNGKEFIVAELPVGMMDKLAALPEEGSEKQILGVLADFVSVDVKELRGIGIIETKGAIDFLAENLLASK